MGPILLFAGPFCSFLNFDPYFGLFRSSIPVTVINSFVLYLKFRPCIIAHFSPFLLLTSCDSAFRSVTERPPSEVYIKWRKHSQLLKDSDFSFQEPVMALRTVILELLMEKEMENSQRECFKDILTKHLVELSVLARTFKNTQVIEFKTMSSHFLTGFLLPRK